MNIDIFNASLLFGLSTFFLLGEIVGIRTIFLNKISLSLARRVWLSLFIGMCYILQGIIYSILLAILGLLLERFLGLNYSTILFYYSGTSFLILGYFVFGWYVTKREVPRIFLSIIFSAVFTYLFSLLIEARINLSLFPVCFGILSIISVSFFGKNYNVKKKKVSHKGKDRGSSLCSYKETGKKLVFLGIDGCDPRLLGRFLENGTMPNFKKLIGQGVYCKTKSIYPTDSPLIWNSIFTGKTPQEHGIDFWYKTKFPGIPALGKNLIYPKGARAGKIIKWLIRKNIIKRIPYSTYDRKVKALWNMLSDCNKKSVNIGWIYTWPAEKINGVQVSWYMYPFEEAAQETKRYTSSNLPKRTYPEHLAVELERFIVRENDISEQEREKMNFTTASIDYRKHFADKLSIWDYAKDKTFLNIAHHLLDEHCEYDFFSLYLFGLDSVCHSYWPFTEEATNKEKYKAQVLSVSDSKKFKKEAESFHKIIERYYEYVDREMGRLLRKVGDDCNIVVVSDHGFDFDSTNHANCPDGIFVAKGPFINKNAVIDSISIYDVLPTLLVLLGLPIAEDMRGKFTKAILKDEFLQKYPVEYIKTYQTWNFKDIDNTVNSNEIEKGLSNRLKALGYID